MVQDVTSMVLLLPAVVNIKVRQPLQCIMVPVVDEEQRAHIEAVKTLIAERGERKGNQVCGRVPPGVCEESEVTDFKKLGPRSASR